MDWTYAELRSSSSSSGGTGREMRWKLALFRALEGRENRSICGECWQCKPEKKKRKPAVAAAAVAPTTTAVFAAIRLVYSTN